MSDQLVVKAALYTNTQKTQKTNFYSLSGTENPISQQPSGCKPTPLTARPPGSPLLFADQRCGLLHEVSVYIDCNLKIHSFISNLSDDRSTASSKTIPPIKCDLELLPSNESILFCPQDHPATSYVFVSRLSAPLSFVQ
jgi:hypothetical protein